MNVEPEEAKYINLLNSEEDKLNGVIPLGSELCIVEGSNLPANLPYNTDLLHVSKEHLDIEVHENSIVYLKMEDTISVDLLQDNFNALNEYAFIMAHLVIASSKVDRYNATYTGTRVGTPKLTSIGNLSTELENHLKQFRPVKPEDMNKSFTVLGMEVLFNEDPDTRENRAFKLTNGHLIPSYQDSSALQIAYSLMEYMTGMYRKTLSKVYQEEK